MECLGSRKVEGMDVVVKKARERITALQAAGKTVKLICVGKKGADQLKRHFANLIVERIELSGEKTITSATSGRIGEKIRFMFETRFVFKARFVVIAKHVCIKN